MPPETALRKFLLAYIVHRVPQQETFTSGYSSKFFPKELLHKILEEKLVKKSPSPFVGRQARETFCGLFHVKENAEDFTKKATLESDRKDLGIGLR